jgi:hypothetical protein
MVSEVRERTCQRRSKPHRWAGRRH